MTETEQARMRQRDFYLEMARRFTKMADEYSPSRYEENPLPIHGYTAIIVLHGSTHEEIASEVHGLDVNWFHHYSRYGNADKIDVSGGREIVWAERIFPEQTPERYKNELDVWFEGRKAARS